MSLKQKIDVKDYLVSGKTFTLTYDRTLDLYQTLPVPLPSELPEFYKSERYISHTDSKKTLTDKIYQVVKKINLRSKIKLINHHVAAKGTLLDVGCGAGDFLKTAQQYNWDVTGIEPNASAREIAAEKLENDSLLYQTLEELPSRQFDVITLWHVLEHVPDYNAYLTKIESLLKPDGLLIIAVPNFNSYDAQFYKQHWAAFDVPRHLWHFSKKSIKMISETHQLTILKIKPMVFDSFYVSLLSEKYQNKIPNYFRAIGIGLLSNIKSIYSGEASSLIYLIKKQKRPN